jgi:hypothetical protein
MTVAWRGVGAVAVCFGLVAAGCSNDDGAAADASFLEGRDMVTVYEQALPEDFDPDAFVTNLGKVFGVGDEARLSRYEGEDDISVELGGGLNNGTGSTAVNLQTLTWGFSSATLSLDTDCRRCEPSNVTNEDAIERAKELFAATGSLIGDYSWTADRAPIVAGSPISTLVVGTRLLLGQPTGDEWLMEFGDGDKVLRANGSAWQPTPIADVGLLTPDEAFAQDTAQTATGSPEISGAATLIYSTFFDRQAVRGFLVPYYSIPITVNNSNDLGLTTSVLAIRNTDFPRS